MARVLVTYLQRCTEALYIQESGKQQSSSKYMCKKGNFMEASSFSPAAIFFHARKVIESAIVYEIQKFYQLNPSQLEFQEGTGKTAIICQIAHTERMRISALLNLKSAYNDPQSQILIKQIKEKLPKQLQSMMEIILQPLSKSRIEDKQKQSKK